MNILSNQAKRDIKALLLTVTLHTPILFLWQNNISKNVLDEPKETILKLNIFKQAPPTPPIIEETSPLEDDTLDELDEIMSEPTPEPIVTPKPIIKEKILSKKPKPIVHKKIVKRVKKSKKRIVKKRTHKRYKKKYISKTPKVSTKNFISKLKRKIEKNKHYPKMAKKRRLDGRVSVSFRVTKSGGVSNISVKGSRLFLKSARDAIKKSFPINIKGVKVPLNVKLTLNYRVTSA